ncbi:hypothetical protein PybrP1_009734 [[Pythium] brassicae (nom. inval.)]|nr:hypothetical protein PybrP1_009734 [[Pythium] brassicae (nom. inval.)]
MSFFGLTGLGSQSPFELAKETPLYVFERADLQDAFMQVFQPGFTLFSESEQEADAARRTLATATLTREQLPAMLRFLYKCPRGTDNVPEAARALVHEGFEAFAGHPIALEAFLSEMEAVKVRAEELERSTAGQRAYAKDGLRSREFVSNNDFRGNLVKHQRMAQDPKDKNLAPMTDAQTLGWSPPMIVTVRRPTKSCEETKYASAMVKAGVYYY